MTGAEIDGHLGSDALLNRQGEPASRIWTAADWCTLCVHLHNENSPIRYVMAFRENTGQKKYVRAKNLPVGKAISWAWSSIAARPKSRIAFVPYSTNKDRMSRWGAMDFDAHDGNHQRARKFAFAAFQCLLNSDHFLILESSGQGWHVWAVSKEFRNVNDWVRLLKDVAERIGVSIEEGVCEIFPPDSLSVGYGKGMRAPGSWNPATDTCNEIYWQNTNELLSDLIPKIESEQLTDIERNNSFSSSFLSLHPFLSRFVEESKITKAGQRNTQLGKLVGEVFHQVSYCVARKLVEEQFDAKTVATKATLEQHLGSFEKYWSGLNRLWDAELSEAEREVYHQLGETDQNAFRIVRSFAAFSRANQDPDFPIAAENFGVRLGMTLQGACEVRKRLVKVGILRPTARFVRNQSAARFAWAL